MIDLVNLIYAWRKEEEEKHRRTEDTWWVTDLVRCPLKREFELRYPELVKHQVFTPFFILGDLAHEGVHSVLSRLGRVEFEVEAEKAVALPDGREARVRGRADAIYYGEGGEKIVIEVKTSRSDAGIPHEHHIDQVRAYLWLHEANEGVLLYVTPDRVTQFPVSDPMTTDEVVERMTSKDYPRYSWECQYCPYSVLCPHKLTKLSR